MENTTAADYLAGLTRAEALNYVHRLPGLHREEFNELIRIAETKPERRQTYFDYSETITLRVNALVKYLLESPQGASTQQICQSLKLNGRNAVYTLRKAQDQGLIYVVRTEKQRKKIYAATKKAIKARGEQ